MLSIFSVTIWLDLSLYSKYFYKKYPLQPMDQNNSKNLFQTTIFAATHLQLNSQNLSATKSKRQAKLVSVLHLPLLWICYQNDSIDLLSYTPITLDALSLLRNEFWVSYSLQNLFSHSLQYQWRLFIFVRTNNFGWPFKLSLTIL